MQFKKRGFSLVELLIIFVIIGIVFFFVMHTLNNRTNQYGTPYYVVYNALKKAAYNVLADMDHYPPRAFPANPQAMCERLTEFINFSEKTCNSNAVNNNATNITDTGKNSTLQFRASNGTKFYISSIKDASVCSELDSSSNCSAYETVKYFIVYVDLNGDNHPNKLDRIFHKNGSNFEYDDLVLPDIVPFAVTTRGEVVPMGYPVIEKSYLTSRVKYPADLNNLDDKNYSDSITFYEAFHRAWGNRDFYTIPMSVDYTSKMPANNVARAFYNLPAAKSIDSSKGCTIATFNCRAVVEQSEFARY